MMLALFDRPDSTVGELAKIAAIAASTASAHVDQLEHVGLVERVRDGRSMRVRFASPEAAAIVEQLLTFSPPELAAETPPSSSSSKIGRLRFARTCYDHLAGGLGVGLAQRLAALDVLDADLQPTAKADDWFASELGIDVGALRSARSSRPLSRSCLDWTHRRPHVAGRLGTAVFFQFRDRGWVAQNPNDRSLRVTEAGERALDSFGVLAQ
jgi:DNA-binding transcriptional ArsR family regulator